MLNRCLGRDAGGGVSMRWERASERREREKRDAGRREMAGESGPWRGRDARASEHAGGPLWPGERRRPHDGREMHAGAAHGVRRSAAARRLARGGVPRQVSESCGRTGTGPMRRVLRGEERGGYPGYTPEGEGGPYVTRRGGSWERDDERDQRRMARDGWQMRVRDGGGATAC